MPCKPHCSFCCIYCTICIFIFFFMLSFFLFMVIIYPTKVKFYISEASITQFNLTSNNTLYYNFKAKIKVRNHNKHVLVYYRRITAIAWYKDNDFDRVSLTPFDQGHKNTTFLQAAFEGQSVMRLNPKQLDEYKEETSMGVYNDLAIDLDLTVIVKFGMFKKGRFNPPIIQCPRSNVPLISNGKSGPSFAVSKCCTGSFFQDRNAY